MNLYGPHPFDNIVTANDARMYIGPFLPLPRGRRAIQTGRESLFSVARARRIFPSPCAGGDIKNENKCVVLAAYLVGRGYTGGNYARYIYIYWIVCLCGVKSSRRGDEVCLKVRV